MMVRHRRKPSADSKKARTFCQVLVLAIMVFLTLPSQLGAWPWTVCGDELLGIGPLGKSDASLFGKTFKPTCNINGTFRTNYVGGRINGDNTIAFAPSLDLDLDIILTATERFHFLFRPFDHGVSGAPARPNRATQWRPRPPSGERKTLSHYDFEPDRAWFEMQPLTWIFPDDRYPLDFTVAGGRIPLAFHNNYWMNEDVLGFAVSKNNIYLPPLQNLNIITFGAFDELNNFDDASFAGIGAFIDYKGYFIETTFAYVWDDTAANDRFFSGVSVTKQFGLTGFALRFLLNEDDGVSGGADLGALFAIETETRLFNDLFYAGEARLYANTFYATRNWESIGGGNVARQGFLFQTDRSITVPSLLNRGIDSGGLAVGMIFNPEGTVTVTPEAGFLRDERKRSRSGKDTAGNLEQIGLGLRIQADLARLFLRGRIDPWYDADFDKIEERLSDYLYGLQLRTTWINIIPTSGQSEHAFRVELLYDF